MEYRKSLSKYYLKWYNDCLDSAEYCRAQGKEDQARECLEGAECYAAIIDKHAEAIEFFSIGTNALLREDALPEKFRGYK